MSSLAFSRPSLAVHLSAILGISLNPLTIATDIAKVFFSSLASLFGTGASALLGALLGFIEETSDPVFSGSWWSSSGEAVFSRVLVVSAFVLALSFLVSILTAVISADQGLLARAIRRLPLAVIETGLLVAVVAALVSASDEISSFVASGSSATLSSFALQSLGIAVTESGIVGIVVAALLVLACLCVWAELLCRSALIYVAVMAGPLIFASSVHPSAQGLKRRYVEMGLALIFSKVVIALAFATGSALLSGISSVPSFAGAIGALMEALTILLVACFSPFLLLRLLLGAEAIVVAEGLERRPARALLQTSATVSSGGLSNMLRGLSSAGHHGEAGSGGTTPRGPIGPIAPTGPRGPGGSGSSGGPSGRGGPSTPRPPASGTRATTPDAPSPAPRPATSPHTPAPTTSPSEEP